MKEVINENDSIKFHAVYVDIENEWNLNYMATAVIANKNQTLLREEQMPPSAIMKESCDELKQPKVDNFKFVAAKLTKKHPPVDPNIQAREDELKRRREENERRRAMDRQKREVERKRIAIEKKTR